MEENTCSKRYPRKLRRVTQTGDDGYPEYNRSSTNDGGFTVRIKGLDLDNHWVVPYNSVLLRTFISHINVEMCNSVKCIKYIYKYVNKVSDQAAFTIENQKDEVTMRESGRYLQGDADQKDEAHNKCLIQIEDTVLAVGETPMCNIPKQSNIAEVLRNCKFIVWDESTMAHKRGFEALDRSLKDIRNNNEVMGGVTVLLTGVFRQTLPVIPRGSRADEVKACIKASYLWLLIEQQEYEGPPGR
ncbi:hypothetical protein QTP88_001520 [Uroleucon formosanum]